MPYADRGPHYRARPLGDQANVLMFPVGDEGDIVVYAAPGYRMFIEAMWSGNYQQVPVDPDEVNALIEVLCEARDYVNAEREAGRSA